MYINRVRVFVTECTVVCVRLDFLYVPLHLYGYIVYNVFMYVCVYIYMSLLCALHLCMCMYVCI